MKRVYSAVLLTAALAMACDSSRPGSISTESLPLKAAWTTTGSLPTRHDGHTATLLPDGKVLVVGGDSGAGTGQSSSAALYDPASGTWSPTASMLDSGRLWHTATLLPNGKVLGAGGYNTYGYRLNDAELYDPASGTWAPTGSMVSAREWHTATLLPSGQVLVAGGYTGADWLATAELYDPTSETWTTTGSMATGRGQHTANLLQGSGKVLVAGGINGGTSAELYDPASGMWTVTGSMAYGRNDHTATLLSGKVLVAGGWGTSSAELYDVASGTWTITAPMSIARDQHTATLLTTGQVLVAGGETGTGPIQFLATAELYSPSSKKWIAAPSMTTARVQHSATLLSNGTVLVAGGGNAGGGTASAELYSY